MPDVASALAHKVTELISTLGLTQEEIGEIVDASGRSVSRWLSGDVVPQRLNKQRLVELAYVAEAVAQVLPAEHANLWMFTPNRLLGHETPAARIREGDYKTVMDLIEALADGVVV
jgi:transcriptional regulator with XRE-family HTH domain